MGCETYASICTNLLHLSRIWGWNALENKFNPNSRFLSVHIICWNDKPGYSSFRRGTLFIHQVPRPTIKALRFPFYLSWLLARHARYVIKKFDIQVIAQLYSHLLSSGIPTVMAGKLAGISSVVTVQNDYHYLFKSTRSYLRLYHLNNIAEFCVYRFATHLRCVSRHLIKHVLEHGVPEKKISFVPRCMDSSIFRTPDREEKNQFIEKYRVKNIIETQVILTVGKLTPQKNHERTIKAFSKIIDEKINALLLIVGHGKLERKLQETARDLGIADYIIFLGKIPQSDLKCAYALSDLFLLPSLFEGRSRAVMEALFYGLPVIVSNIDSNREIVENNYNGILVDPGDENDIAEAILQLLKNEHMLIRLSKSAKKSFREDYSIEECYERKAMMIKNLM